MNIPILYQDASLLIINKPVGVVVNKAESVQSETIQDWAEKRLKIPPESKLKTKELDETEFYRRGGIIHRLDKETSGVLLIAKTPAAFSNLQKQFAERIVNKTYLALVHGVPPAEAGEINVPVGRLPWNRKRFGVVVGGKESLTRYQRQQTFVRPSTKEKYTLLLLSPETGRTHQIRVHLKYLGYSIVADPVYAGRKQLAEDRRFCPRLFLHAASISFVHPTTKKTMCVSAPQPPELASALSALKPDNL